MAFVRLPGEPLAISCCLFIIFPTSVPTGTSTVLTVPQYFDRLPHLHYSSEEGFSASFNHYHKNTNIQHYFLFQVSPGS